MAIKTASKPLEWIEQIEATIFELEKRPQFGLPAPFDLVLLEEKLRALFERPSLKVSYESKGWVLPEHHFDGLGEPLVPLLIDLTPLESPAYFVTTEQDLKHLMTDLLEGEEGASFFYERHLSDGFYHYFAAEVLRILAELQFASPLTPRLGEAFERVPDVIPNEPCFLIDVSLSLPKETFWGRILLPERFQGTWRSYFAHLPPPALTEKMSREVLVDLALEVGYAQVSLEEFKQVKVGDFLLLDHCSYDPDTERGGVILKWQEKPIFRGRLKEEGIKLTNYPEYVEVRETVDEEFLSKEEENLYEDEAATGEEEGEELFNEMSEAEEEKIATTPVPEEEQSFVTPEEIPLQLTVEVGRLRMTVQELMKLAPGNLLELNVTAREGVDLVVNGKKVGRGELIRIGEALGVRILSL